VVAAAGRLALGFAAASRLAATAALPAEQVLQPTKQRTTAAGLAARLAASFVATASRLGMAAASRLAGSGALGLAAAGRLASAGDFMGAAAAATVAAAPQAIQQSGLGATSAATQGDDRHSKGTFDHGRLLRRIGESGNPCFAGLPIVESPWAP